MCTNGAEGIARIAAVAAAETSSAELSRADSSATNAPRADAIAAVSVLSAFAARANSGLESDFARSEMNSAARSSPSTLGGEAIAEAVRVHERPERGCGRAGLRGGVRGRSRALRDGRRVGVPRERVAQAADALAERVALDRARPYRARAPRRAP